MNSSKINMVFLANLSQSEVFNFLIKTLTEVFIILLEFILRLIDFSNDI